MHDALGPGTLAELEDQPRQLLRRLLDGSSPLLLRGEIRGAHTSCLGVSRGP